MSFNTHPLRELRERFDLSMDDLANESGVSARTIMRAEQGKRVYPGSRRLLREYFTGVLGRPVSSVELGLIDDTEAHRIVEETEDMKRRNLLKGLLTAVALPVEIDIDRLASVFAHPASLDTDSLKALESVVQSCWHMSNESRVAEVERIIPVYLPQIVTLAHQPTKHQRKAAHLASQAYILTAEIDRGPATTMKAYCQQAVLYSQIADNPDIQVAALKQQATILLIDKQPGQALEVYRRALPLVDQVTPLLRSRIYLGLASAYARCEQPQAAMQYLGMARDSFPKHPEDDANYLYTVCDLPVLHLYEALTYTDLKQYNDAWQALMRVDGMTPKLPVPENTRIEFINLQAKTSAMLGDMERSRAYLAASVEATKAYGYSLLESEAHETYQALTAIWPAEQQIKDLQEMFM